jgi:polysaccharide pyruvyl transferase WcaK-like protein
MIFINFLMKIFKKLVKMTTIILGYYGKQNLGDDLFQLVFSKWLTDNLIFLDPLEIDVLPECDRIIIGGGDLVNDYFMEKIRILVNGLSVPIYGVGLGFPYPQLISREYLDIFDFIITRTKSVIPKLEEIKPGKIMYGDDLARSLETEVKRSFTNKPKPIGVFLANSTMSNPQVLDKVVNVIKKIANIQYPGFKFTKLYTIYLYSMNTSQTVESDLIISQKVYERVGMSNVQIIKTPIHPEKAVDLFANFYATICTRYHAHILSLCANVPFVSLFSSFKVKDLLQTESLMEWSEEMIVDEALVPVDFNEEGLFNKFQSLMTNYQRVKNVLRVTNCDEVRQTIHNLCFYGKTLFPSRSGNCTMKKVIKYFKSAGLYENNILPIVTNENAHLISRIITFAISRTEEQSFTWGLEQNLLAGQSIEEAVKWLVTQGYQPDNKYLLNSTVPFGDRKFNLHYFNPDLLAGMHRSGWQYVVDNIKPYHNPDGIIFDCYLDKTFGWQKDFYRQIGVLPFRKEWTGIFHHTPDRDYDINNLSAIIESRSFLSSLKYCKRLFTLSQYLADWLQSQLPTVQVVALHHPSEPVENIWTKSQWLSNGDKKLIQIGAWMRDVFAIYTLASPIRKCALRGKQMDNYFPTRELVESFTKSTTGVDYSTIQACRHTTNKFLTCLYDYVHSSLKSVGVIEFLENEDYDRLLSENIVFLKLINCSACNTIIECILRNTPIVVNRLPATEEYLGKDYPLFYTTLDQATELLKSPEKILEANSYLENMDKSFLSIEIFLEKLVKLEWNPLIIF